MFLRINSFLPINNSHQAFSIFGYLTNGVPGVEIRGLQKANNIIREKIIYYTKMHQVKVPLKRYHLCIDFPNELSNMKKDMLDESLLELPILLLYWNLCQAMDFHELDNCFSLGKISSNGKIDIPEIDDKYIKNIAKSFYKKNSRKIIFINNINKKRPAETNSSYFTIAIDDLLRPVFKKSASV